MKKRVILAAMACVLLVFLWWARPWFHGLVMLAVKYPVPPLLFLGVLACGVTVIELHSRRLRYYEDPKGSWLLAGATLSLAVTVAVAVGFARPLVLRALAQETTYAPVDTLPDVQDLRLLPYEVAESIARDAHQEPTHQLYDFDLQLWEGKLSWVAGRTPDGMILYFARKAIGLGVVDATTERRSVAFPDTAMQVAEGIGVTDNVYWQLLKRRYFVDLPELFYGKLEGEIVAIVPIVAYRGVFVRRPYFDGCYLVRPNGSIETVSAGSAPTHPAVRSAGRVYPEWLVRLQHDAYAYRRGIWNVLAVHEEQTEIPDPPGTHNAQPYLTSTADGLKWMSAADPYGNSYAVYRIFLTDALTGATSLFSLPRDAGLTGVEQAVGYVQSSFPQFNWHKGNGEKTEGNIVAVEPRPMTTGGELYWMMSVSSTAYKGVERTCFVHARTNKVTSFTSGEDAELFAQSGVVREASLPDVGTTPEAGDRLERVRKLEALLRQALTELEGLKK